MKQHKPFNMANVILKGHRDLLRWRRKAKQCFVKNKVGPEYWQWDRAVDLARDVYKTLDPVGWKKND